MNKESINVTNKAAEEEAAKAFDKKKKEIDNGFYAGIKKIIKSVWQWFASWF